MAPYEHDEACWSRYGIEPNIGWCGPDGLGSPKTQSTIMAGAGGVLLLRSQQKPFRIGVRHVVESREWGRPRCDASPARQAHTAPTRTTAAPSA
jgi:hypothetical protein